MRITSKGQVTIPQEVRESAGFMPGTDVEFSIEGDAVRIIKHGSGRRPTRGQSLVSHLRGVGNFAMSTDAIIALMRGPAADDDAPSRG